MSHHIRRPLGAGWSIAEVAAGAAAGPAELAALRPEWLPATAPGTAASALRALGRWSLDTPKDFDAGDWWFRHELAVEAAAEVHDVLRFDGLATLADVYLDGEPLLSSDNMFLAHAVPLGERLRQGGRHELLIRCRALAPELARRRPRPAWRTRLVRDQQLRWIRTTLLGRMPGWSPPVAPVGPWRPVVLERRRAVSVETADLRTGLDGTAGLVDATISLDLLDGQAIVGATLAVGESVAALDLEQHGSRVELRGRASVPSAERWWPHTHGAQPLYPCELRLARAGGEIVIDLGRVGFRTLEVEDTDGGFGLRINGVPIFCRGACWTTTDVVTLHGTAEAYAADLSAARRAGMNMLRLGGTMMYESDAFYDRCDELGILVWQDFMFANMSYPADDAAFRSSVQLEARQLLDRLAGRPSLAVLCGGSEVEQQAAMLGLPRASWRGPLFDETLPALCRERRPDVAWLPSSPTGGTLPFQADSGVTHYYGVGAYLRPLDDARRADVRFASECLGFANVPDAATINALLGAGEAPVHHPTWKARVPRDSGASWDFEDVRDHYLQELFGADPLQLRHRDVDRYLALSQVVTGEVIAAVIGEWRRPASRCRGALVWFFRDLWPGAGWGVIDALGRTKAAYHYLRRACQPVAAFISDEGVNGLRLHAVNDGPAPIAAELRIGIWRDGETMVGSACTAMELPAHGAQVIHLDALFDGFRDLSYAYRFGPPPHDLVAASLHDRASGDRLADAFHFPLGRPTRVEVEIGLAATASPLEDGAWRLTVRTRRFAQSIRIEADGFTPSDDVFHLAPGDARSVRLVPTGGRAEPFGRLVPLNASTPSPIEVVR